MRSRLRQQSGFTVVELIITTCIVAVLASVAIASMRDYSRRAKMSEIVMAGSNCKSAVSEIYPVRSDEPDPGSWGCEQSAGNTTYVGSVQTSSTGRIRITIRNVDPWINGRHIFLVPARSDGLTALTADDFGSSVRGWICGSDYPLVLNSLPSSCRADVTTYASVDYE